MGHMYSDVETGGRKKEARERCIEKPHLSCRGHIFTSKYRSMLANLSRGPLPAPSLGQSKPGLKYVVLKNNTAAVHVPTKVLNTLIQL